MIHRHPFLNMLRWPCSGEEVMTLNKKKGAVFILIGAASFGFTPVFAKLGFSYGYSLGQLNIVQMIISFFILWGISLIKRSSFKGLTRKSLIQIMLTGTSVGLTTIFYYG